MKTDSSIANASSEGPPISYRHYVPYNFVFRAILTFLHDQGGSEDDNDDASPTLREIGTCLEIAVRSLYQGCETFPESKLRAPGDCPVCPKDNATWEIEWEMSSPCPERTRSSGTDRQGCSHCIPWATVEMSKKRYAAMAWISWAMEAICDYPDNIYYGRGTGDGGGTLVDVPLGLARPHSDEYNDIEVAVIQLRTLRVRQGASMLFQCLEPKRHVSAWLRPNVLYGTVDIDGRPDPVLTNGLMDSTEHVMQGVPLQAVKVVEETVFFIDPDMILSRFLGDSPFSDNRLKQLYSTWSVPLSWKQCKPLWTIFMVAQQIFNDHGSLRTEDMASCAERIYTEYGTWCGELGRVPELQESEDFIRNLKCQFEQKLLVPFVDSRAFA